MTFFRYLLIQLLAYCIDMGAFLFLLHFDFAGPILANIASKIAAGCFAFVAHRAYTFNMLKSPFVGWQAARYFIVLAANVPVASAILVFILIFEPSPVIAKFLADVVSVGISYFVSKKFIFITKSDNSEKSRPGSSTR